MEKQKTIEPGIAIRIIAIPVMLLFALFWSIKTLIKFLIDYVRYGGEMIVYSKQSSRTTILDCFEKLVEIQKRESEPVNDVLMPKFCSNCKHVEKPLSEEPCVNCGGHLCRWEPQEKEDK